MTSPNPNRKRLGEWRGKLDFSESEKEIGRFYFLPDIARKVDYPPLDYSSINEWNGKRVRIIIEEDLP